MEECDVRRLGVILAIQARIEAMKVENKIRESLGESLAYTEENFKEESELLGVVAGLANFQIIEFATEGKY